MQLKIDLTIDEAKQLRDEWERTAVSFEGEAASLRARIASIEIQMAGYLPQTQNHSAAVSSSAPQSAKRKKGENLRIITGFLKTTAEKGCTPSDVKKGTGLGISSIMIVLNRHEDAFNKGTDGLWRLK